VTKSLSGLMHFVASYDKRLTNCAFIFNSRRYNKAAKIAGNMCALVADAKDMSPYVPLLLPEIQKALVDPIPEVGPGRCRSPRHRHVSPRIVNPRFLS